MNPLENFYFNTDHRLPGSAALCKEQGISARAVSMALGPVIWRVRFESDRFVADTNGEKAGVLPVIESGYFTDLVAFNKDRVAVYDRRAFCLGPDNFYLLDGPLRIFRHPIPWLQNDCAGIAILRHEIAWRELDRVEAIAAEDEAHAVELERLLMPPKPLTKILFPAEKHAA